MDLRELMRLPPLDLRQERRGRRLRFTSVIDQETEQFEEELQQIIGELPLPQRHAWLRWCQREYRLLQVRDPAGRAAYQAVVHVARPRLLPLVGQGTARKLGVASSPEEERQGLRLLRELCREAGDLLTLRLQPRRLDPQALQAFAEHAASAGFAPCEPEGVTRTLLLDLRGSREELLATLPKKTRYLLRSRERFTGEIRVLDDPAVAPACQAAAAAALARTGVRASVWEWDTLFSVARQRPDLLRLVGLYLPGRPQGPVAFASAVRHGETAEYASAGSLDDPELRKLPFNYWLLDCLFDWARQHGARYMDLGGVTPGGPDDPLAGISAFKRKFCDVDIEVGREMLAVLRPVRLRAVEAIRAVVHRTRAAPA